MGCIGEGVEKFSSRCKFEIEDVLTEADAGPGGKWEQYLLETNETENADVQASDKVVVSVKLRAELFAKGHPYEGPWSADLQFLDSDGEELDIPKTRPLQNKVTRSSVNSVSDASTELIVPSPSSTSSNRNDHANGKGNTDGRNKENQNGSARSFFDKMKKNDSNTLKHDASSSNGNGGELVKAEEAEKKHILKLFKDFPNCIAKVTRVVEDDAKYSITSIDKSEEWTIIPNDSMPQRIREWIADLTINHAFIPGIHDSSGSSSVMSDSHLWLAITWQNEFVINSMNCTVWYKALSKEPAVALGRPEPNAQ
ncbi:hypothetical protein M406DRAFT_70655 [Cryphonectria parasitica EP155]|uniref:Uncharacterized protein n=1 Tax=Cryphonectria parasitica (strain ATCC 38755 / EP155) TaxID=660469 RepID=A0A9P4Y1A4_CRYP1|nr:uncharacterized protein M406DRAFT_70655 [Cryphonectria parasitica EP155]KAF3764833.1 hypothetical protein M406DRAFT_70655 [Cryphonectria parasitica EP155]